MTPHEILASKINEASETSALSMKDIVNMMQPFRTDDIEKAREHLKSSVLGRFDEAFVKVKVSRGSKIEQM